MEKYTKVKKIGKGGMGQCILVRRNEDAQDFIMKLIDLSNMSKKERNASLHEAKVLSSLSHPNVIRYEESFLSRKNDQLCIVMEYAQGGDLAAQVKLRKRIPEPQILDWLIQVCASRNFCSFSMAVQEERRVESDGLVVPIRPPQQDTNCLPPSCANVIAL